LDAVSNLIQLINKKKLENRIKKNEGYANTAYEDQLGYLTIGYGHLVRKKDKIKKEKKYTKDYLEKLFNKDFNSAIKSYKKIFKNHKIPNQIQGVLIEMIFQLGERGFRKFKKLIRSVKDKQYTNTTKEMKNSKWYKQTPKRAKKLILIVNENNE